MKLLINILLCFAFVSDKSAKPVDVYIKDNYLTAIKEIKRREGLKLQRYTCISGKKTIGFGQTGCRLKTIDTLEANLMLHGSFKQHYDRAKREFPGRSVNKCLAIAMLTYNIGWNKLKTFKLYWLLKCDARVFKDWYEIRFYRSRGRLVESENLKKARLFELKLYNL